MITHRGSSFCYEAPQECVSEEAAAGCQRQTDVCKDSSHTQAAYEDAFALECSDCGFEFTMQAPTRAWLLRGTSLRESETLGS